MLDNSIVNETSSEQAGKQTVAQDQVLSQANALTKKIWIEKKKEKNKENNISQAVRGTLSHRLQRRTMQQCKMATRGPQNCQQDLKTGLSLNFWAFSSTFAK